MHPSNYVPTSGPRLQIHCDAFLHCSRRNIVTNRLKQLYATLFVLPIRTSGLALRDKHAAAVAMASDVADSLVATVHFPHHELVALSLHLIYSILLLTP